MATNYDQQETVSRERLARAVVSYLERRYVPGGTLYHDEEAGEILYYDFDGETMLAIKYGAQPWDSDDFAGLWKNRKDCERSIARLLMGSESAGQTVYDCDVVPCELALKVMPGESSHALLRFHIGVDFD